MTGFTIRNKTKNSITLEGIDRTLIGEQSISNIPSLNRSVVAISNYANDTLGLNITTPLISITPEPIRNDSDGLFYPEGFIPVGLVEESEQETDNGLADANSSYDRYKWYVADGTPKLGNTVQSLSQNIMRMFWGRIREEVVIDRLVFHAGAFGGETGITASDGEEADATIYIKMYEAVSKDGRLCPDGLPLLEASLELSGDSSGFQEMSLDEPTTVPKGQVFFTFDYQSTDQEVDFYFGLCEGSEDLNRIIGGNGGSQLFGEGGEGLYVGKSYINEGYYADNEVVDFTDITSNYFNHSEEFVPVIGFHVFDPDD